MNTNAIASLCLSILTPVLLAPACSAEDDLRPDEDLPAEQELAVTRPVAGPGRPASVPESFVATPNGYFHPSCVVEVAEDEHVKEDGSVARTDGTARKTPRCEYPRYDRDGRVVEAVKSPDGVSPLTVHGWVASTQVSGTAFGRVSATWNVPGNPGILRGNQVIYLFPGIQGSTILQPVLGWNMADDGIGWRWTIASWNCCRDGTVHHSPLIQVSQGDEIAGSVVGRNCGVNGVCNDFDVVTTNNRTGQSTTLHTGSWGSAETLLFGGALELYNGDHCAQYPSSSSAFFHHIDVATSSGDPVDYTWSRVIDYNVNPWCANDIYAPDRTTTTLSWAPLARPRPERPGCGRIVARQGIVPLESVLSCSSEFILQMQLDGNLVLYYLNANGSLGPALWATNTFGNARAYDAVMQTDGNFVLYDISGNPLWSTRTHGHPGAYLDVQNDGNLVVYAANGAVLWHR